MKSKKIKNTIKEKNHKLIIEAKKIAEVNSLKLETNEQVYENINLSPEEEKKIQQQRKIINIITISGMIILIILSIFAYKAGYFTDKEKLTHMLKVAGIWGPIIFIILQLVQVIIPIIPGGITILIGIIVFGPVWGFIYNYVGIILGSIGAFYLARMYGTTLVRAMTKPATYDKYITWLNKNNKKFEIGFFLLMIAPIAPDDFLCMIAGLSKMPFRRFLIYILIGKFPGIIAYSLFLDKIADMIKHFFGFSFLVGNR